MKQTTEIEITLTKSEIELLPEANDPFVRSVDSSFLLYFSNDSFLKCFSLVYESSWELPQVLKYFIVQLLYKQYLFFAR